MHFRLSDKQTHLRLKKRTERLVKLVELKAPLVIISMEALLVLKAANGHTNWGALSWMLLWMWKDLEFDIKFWIRTKIFREDPDDEETYR